MIKLNVLIIDDDEITLKLLDMILANNLYIASITTAKDGLEAMEILERRFDINLILLDIYMPRLDGFEFLNNFKQRKYLQDIPIIAISTDISQRQKALEFGVYDFIVKPISKKSLNKFIKKIANALG
ncbi:MULTISPECIES: response regulator [Campylobacter]|uniref:Response regulator n=1 Tax=Campylobacter porcelli TaxID=1660073 RepID=A0A1X9SV84_9BACT|nr:MULTISPECIES: response regulator [unclassified Campylobacter]MCR8696705.1 response regulator [Campylobacter sp. RM19073]MEE3705152.1 response regulator [Campylobacter sp. CX2-8023-23]MEE3744773.1 response regulator [Campylobacter sp. CX2-4855-23]MEE3777097.1 response regulator [Campylobacter sp. CX2-4080-23]ARR00141.1 two-component system receiver domain protein [Campylobacter sp. RM6137]